MATAANTVYKLQKTQYVVANNTMIQNADMIIRGNLTIIGGQTYANSQTLLVRDNIITLNAAINQSGIPTMDAGIEIDRGSEQNVAIMWKESQGVWQFTNDGVNYETLGGGSAGSYANSAFIQANAAYNAANNASDTWVRNQANNAYTHANAAYDFANNSSLWSTRQAFVATDGQTSFSVGSGYLPDYVDVFYNGLKLYGGEDYTATDGVNVILTNAATVNSIVEIVGFGANVAAANVYVLNSMTSLLNRQTFFATDGQTTFVPSQTYRVGYVDVYYNGLKLNIPEDVTASDGTNIVFVGLTPTTNDVIEVVGLTPNVALANAIPITGGSVSGGLTLAGNVLPSSTNTYYLGSATSRWHSIFVGPGSVDIGGLKLSNVAGTLSVSSPGQPAVPIAGEDNWVRSQANASFLQANSAFNAANSVNVYAANTTNTSHFTIPTGTTAQRPENPANGAIRLNTTTNNLELYSNGWKNIYYTGEIVATGGTVVYSGNYKIHVFTGSGIFSITSIAPAAPVEYLVVAGGGGGGGRHAGGGGGGGVVYTATYTGFTVGNYPITVGAGATGAQTDTFGGNGSNSAISGVDTGIGGGGGGSYNGSSVTPGRSGGSGGGGGHAPATGGSANQISSLYGTVYGNSGGNGASNEGGGGGGAGGAGSNAVGESRGGDGGPGVLNSIYGSAYYWAGGGGGGGWEQPAGNGGIGGGGGGGATAGSTGGVGGTGGGSALTPGTSGPSTPSPGGFGGPGGTNTGGGGGGGAQRDYLSYAATGGNGGSGIVIIKYRYQ